MSDKKPDKKEKEGAAEGEKKAEGGGGGIMTKLPVLLSAVMIVEALVIFGGWKVFGGGPKTAAAVELTTKEEGGEAKGEKGEKGEGGKPAIDKKAMIEVKLVEGFRSPNKASGHLYFYDVDVYVRTKGAHAEALQKNIEANSSLIKDRLRTIIANSDPEKLGGGSEPGLETFRRQVKFQLDEIVGEGLIDEVLVPKCIPFPTGS